MDSLIGYRIPGQNGKFYQAKSRTTESAGPNLEKGCEFTSFNGQKSILFEALKPISDPEEFSFYPSEHTRTDWDQSAYEKAFKTLQDNISSGQLRKVILSRTISIQKKTDPISLFSELEAKYPNAFIFLVSSELCGTWIAATPEILLQTKENQLHTVSLAGTKSEYENWTEKEQDEQQLVTDFILKVLEDNQCKNIIVDGPNTINAGPVQHLKSDITAELDHPESWKSILKNLHPTPAVCGIPLNNASVAIQETEEHDRLFYTGYFGIIEENSTSFYVNLRCLSWSPEQVRLYVGGGITAGSNAQSEWQETQKKAETILSAIK